MTPSGKKLKALVDRMLTELDEKALCHACFCLELGSDRLFMEAEFRRMKAQQATATLAPRRTRKVKLGGNVVAFKGTDPVA